MNRSRSSNSQKRASPLSLRTRRDIGSTTSQSSPGVATAGDTAQLGAEEQELKVIQRLQLRRVLCRTGTYRAANFYLRCWCYDEAVDPVGAGFSPP